MTDEIKYWIGGMILTNLATIGLIVGWIFKGGMFVSETRMGIADAKDCGIRAHVRIDKSDKRIDDLATQIIGV